jgi:hypothetical protein
VDTQPGAAVRGGGWIVAAVVAVLVAINVIDVRIAHAALVAGPATALGLLLIARWVGLSWDELELGRGTRRRGLAWR